MENEEKVEETTETNDEELEETTTDEVEEETNEETEDDDSNIPSVADYEALQKKLKTIEAQKEHWRKKATSKPLEKKEDFNKTNNVSEEDLIRTAKLASQLDDDDLEVLQSLSGSLKEKIENPLFKAYKENKEKKLKSESASLKPSTRAKVSAPKANMTPEEHKAWVKKLMS